jgi:hypothetical protein
LRVEGLRVEELKFEGLKTSVLVRPERGMVVRGRERESPSPYIIFLMLVSHPRKKLDANKPSTGIISQALASPTPPSPPDAGKTRSNQQKRLIA